MNDELCNEALQMSLEWGENWQAPIGARIVAAHPHLNEKQVEELDVLCRHVQKFAFALYAEVYFEKMTRADAEAKIKAKFWFLDAHNLSRLYNQGMYYAWHG